MEKFAKDLEGFLGPCSLPRSDFFAPLWKDNRYPQLRVFPAWGSPQTAKLASKLTSHSTGHGGGRLSPADGEESCSENNSQDQEWTLLSAVLWLWNKCSRCWCGSGCLLTFSSFFPLQGKIKSLQYHTEMSLCACPPQSTWPATKRDPQSGYWKKTQGWRCLQDRAFCQSCMSEDSWIKIY